MLVGRRLKLQSRDCKCTNSGSQHEFNGIDSDASLLESNVYLWHNCLHSVNGKGVVRNAERLEEIAAHAEETNRGISIEPRAALAGRC